MRPHDATDVLVAVPQLLGELQKLRDVMADAWAETQLIHALHTRARGGRAGPQIVR